MATKLRERLTQRLVEDGFLKSAAEVPHAKSRHGCCCTCQTCGYHYDDCVCDNNRLLALIAEVFDAAEEGE